jgi:hypothetical protein
LLPQQGLPRRNIGQFSFLSISSANLKPARRFLLAFFPVHLL